MARRKGKTVTGARQWLGNLLVGWTVVTGMALVLASAWYHRTGDLKILIAYLGAPFIVGTCLFILIGVVSLLGRTRAPDVEEAPLEKGTPHRRRRASVFGTLDPANAPARGATAQQLHPGLELPRSDRVAIEARPTEDDLTELHRTKLERRHARLAVFVLATAAAVAWTKLLMPELATFDPVSVLPLAYLGGATVYLARLLREPRRLARRDERPPARYEFGPEGVQVVSPEGKGRYAWSGIEGVRETPRLVLVRTREGHDLLIPKHSVGADSLARLREMVAHHVAAA